jgi:hypothetical protein
MLPEMTFERVFELLVFVMHVYSQTLGLSGVVMVSLQIAVRTLVRLDSRLSRALAGCMGLIRV